MKLIVYRLMYRLTNDRRWVIRFVDEMDKKILEDINNWRFRNGYKN